MSTIPLLTDKELEELGVKTIGDRAVLRKRCREAEQGMYCFIIIVMLRPIMFKILPIMLLSSAQKLSSKLCFQNMLEN